mmetsp:Transcript_6190/g.16508  ORF Transcript_6190/g.16508 Transcript_6190/m.16508 type:complete len:98 (+) Transcript_6190:1276-1569(+)
MGHYFFCFARALQRCSVKLDAQCVRRAQCFAFCKVLRDLARVLSGTPQKRFCVQKTRPGAVLKAAQSPVAPLQSVTDHGCDGAPAKGVSFSSRVYES